MSNIISGIESVFRFNLLQSFLPLMANFDQLLDQCLGLQELLGELLELSLQSIQFALLLHNRHHLLLLLTKRLAFGRQ